VRRPKGFHRALGRGLGSQGRVSRTIATALVLVIATRTAACSSFLSSGAPDLLDPKAAKERSIQFAAGTIRRLDHPSFSHMRAEEGLWAPRAMLREVGAGIYFLEPYDPNRIPVLFIHGIGGTPRDFQELIGSLDRSRFQAWVFHYPTGLRLEVAVGMLKGLIDRLRYKYGFDTLFVTAHSAGGLVARSYVESTLGGSGQDLVRLLITFSSPWGGHRWAAIGARYMPNPVPSWFDLSPGSEFLSSLSAPLKRGGHSIPHYVFFGFRRSMSLISTDSSDGTISVASQLPVWIQEQAEHCWGYNVSHAAILSNRAAVERYEHLIEIEANRLWSPDHRRP
jgi:pimeloyl-ACP methyl ester carboxylesterase